MSIEDLGVPTERGIVFEMCCNHRHRLSECRAAVTSTRLGADIEALRTNRSAMAAPLKPVIKPFQLEKKYGAEEASKLRVKIVQPDGVKIKGKIRIDRRETNQNHDGIGSLVSRGLQVSVSADQNL
eukprot:TRINITY_DN9111_c0_g1_i3.p3 TRINITY_DN9111_c0_g1~~TRINITY_DN9111_c0_g1_i3.p3  ORF type:complete len:126 (+),score=8.75 TRINITY_DN9111_c0_g1_i3:173-550(+)